MALVLVALDVWQVQVGNVIKVIPLLDTTVQNYQIFDHVVPFPKTLATLNLR